MRPPRVLTALTLAAALNGCNAASDRVDDPSTVDAATTGATASPTAASARVQTIEVSYADGSVRPRAYRPKVPLGAKVHLLVHADVSDEIHLHTYERHAEITGGLATIDFTADIPGLFDVELEGKHYILLQLQVG